ncbi:hypothetical protein DH2020_015718 [Rehmannia glutinosa]|uniref:Endonuclease/exonuclease/phosphatase domain-containing protein n=1 Tax=Rehmannia glutinosa TaxID=99300 RepID=A0ABR0WU00_REHGL
MQLEEEEGGLLIEGQELEDQSQDLRWCLMGHLLSERSVNFMAIKNTLASIWRPVKGVIIKELGPNLLVRCQQYWSRRGIALLWRKKDMAQLLSFSSNHIDVSVHLENTVVYRLTGFYGFPERYRRRQSWNFLRQLVTQSNLPWCILGDFNDLLSILEKRGNIEHPAWLISSFRNAVDDCKLIDLGMEGYQFTWERGRGSLNWIEERLDMCFSTQNWFANFPNCKVWNLEAIMSDHSPIFLELGQQYRIKRVKKFRFENAWTREKDCCEVVVCSWN